MLPADPEWLERYLAEKMGRIRAGNDLVREQLAKSQRQIALSEELLSIPPPKIWQADPQKK